MEMLTGYASAHQHPFNVAIHMVGIPSIMFGASVALSWVSFDVGGFSTNLAYVVTFALFAFYLTLDKLFSVVFLLLTLPVVWLATMVGYEPLPLSATVAALAFFGGYLAQFIGHAVEKSVPVIFKHPIQANLAAPFFTVVELFQFLGLRNDLFSEVQRQLKARRQAQTDATS